MIDQFIGKNLAEKYRIEAQISDSDLGKVYRGTHLVMNKLVTVKILSPALAVDESIVRQFSGEARTTSQITHPNILNVTDFGSDTNGTVYIIYEGIEGENLREIIKTSDKFTAARAIDIAKQIASALAAAHEHNVIHGALSSRDIVVAADAENSETVKVLNFASGNRPFETDSDDDAVESVEYGAPEIFSGEGEADERSDIYSLGVILYEMLAGRVPFSGDNTTEVMLKHAEEPPAALSGYRQDLPAEIEPVLLKALAKDPDARYQSADEFLAALERVPLTQQAAAAGTNIWKTAFIVMVGTLLLAAALIYATSSRQTNPATQLQPDANGLPVQPINPATGTGEDALANMAGLTAAEMLANTNMSLPPDTIPGGDGYNPWASGTTPPAGAPVPVGPAGQVITIDPNNPSPFTQDDNVILVPVQVDANGRPIQAKPGKTPPASDVNTQPDTPPKATPTPKTTTTPEAKPPTTMTPQPRKTPIPSTKKPESGKTRDS